MDEHSPGNYGLMDIIQALKWIQTYIERFHGKKEEVSLISRNEEILVLIFSIYPFYLFFYLGDACRSRVWCCRHFIINVIQIQQAKQ